MSFASHAARCALVLGLLAVTPAGVAHAAGESCDGKAATIVGDGTRAEITGTNGPDVIVSNNAARVFAGGGDDTICTTGVVSLSRSVKVFDGTGDDVVINQATYVDNAPDGVSGTLFDVFLTEGDDRFVGNDTPEFVSGDSGDDTIETNGGDDYVGIGTPEIDAPARPLFVGHVDIGDGGRVAVGPDVGPATTIATHDPATSDLRSADAGVWSIDVPAGIVSRDGTPRLHIDGFARFSFGSVDSFLGSPGDDVLWTSHLGDAGFGAGDDTLHAVQGSVAGQVDLGDGDDYAEVGAPVDGETSDVDGSTGTDVLRLDTTDYHQTIRGAVDVDLGSNTVDFGPDAGRFLAHGFEQIAAQADRVTYRGTAQDDVIDVTGCHVAVDAGAGDDTVRAVRLALDLGRPARGKVAAAVNDCTKRSAVDVDLGDGPDRLRSTYFAKSSVAGGRGRDVIVATGSVAAGPGDDTVRSLRSQDSVESVHGGTGDDRISGFGGRDSLRGGSGYDVTRGGAGNDLCRAEVEAACER